jgi:Ca2+-transporting ATPase
VSSSIETMQTGSGIGLGEGPDASIHQVRVDQVFPLLGSRPQGLTLDEVRVRFQQYGPNGIRREVGKSIWRKFAANFTHLMAWLLWVGGVMAWIAQTPQLAVAVWMVNVINGVFSFWQEYRAEKATEALQQLLPSYARVLREGREALILAEELVPGDLMLLGEGDRISADARLIQEAELRVDQSTLTGETHPLRKTSEAFLETWPARSDIPNLVFAGTSVAAGTGRAMVLCHGHDHGIRQDRASDTDAEGRTQPAAAGADRGHQSGHGYRPGFGVLFSALAVLLAGIDPASGFLFALGMIVAFVPEGMLPTVTLSLAMGVQRMARRHALIKRLSAVETHGCTTVICTDKTGTLTQNEMTVCILWLAGRRFTVSGVGYAPQGKIIDGKQVVPVPAGGDLRLLLLAAVLCNNARLVPPTEKPEA